MLALPLLLLVGLATAAEEPIQRMLADIYLGDRFQDVPRIYPPAQEWPSYIEPRDRVRRYRLARQYLKTPPPEIDTMFLGVRHDRVVEIQLIYTAAETAKRPVDEVARQLTLMYGEARRAGSRFWWADGKTVLRVFYETVPVLKDRREVAELRTSVQLVDESLYRGVE